MNAAKFVNIIFVCILIGFVIANIYWIISL